MRVVIDTNILISSLIAPGGVTDRLYQAWRAGEFTLVTSQDQLEEFRRVSRYAKLRPYFTAAEAGTMLNKIQLLADVLENLPQVDVSRDPEDNFLLGMAEAGHVQYLVTGDRRGLLHMKRYHKTHIVTAREMIAILDK